MHQLTSGPEAESPIESIFEEAFIKHSAAGVVLERQREFITQLGTFRVDFAIKQQGLLIGIECDGREFHDSFRDEIRDAVILGEGHLDTMYRFTGPVVYYAAPMALEYIRALPETYKCGT